jgi:maltose-binding protein MalE
MENAAKALTIAGGILIAMMVISLGVYLFINARDVGTSYEKSMETAELQKFNSNFTTFEGREDITIQEIVTIAKFVKQYKEQTEIDVEVNLQGKGNLADKSELYFVEELIEKESTYIELGQVKIKYYKCEIEYVEEKVKSITFKPI